MALSMNIATSNNTLNLTGFSCKETVQCSNNPTRINVKPLHCMPVQQQVDSGIMCDSCSGKGWLLCDFCKGEKTNVRSQNNRIYRRCPSCKAIGSILCTKCKVYRCVTFPDQSDGQELTF